MYGKTRAGARRKPAKSAEDVMGLGSLAILPTLGGVVRTTIGAPLPSRFQSALNSTRVFAVMLKLDRAVTSGKIDVKISCFRMFSRP